MTLQAGKQPESYYAHADSGIIASTLDDATSLHRQTETITAEVKARSAAPRTNSTQTLFGPSAAAQTLRQAALEAASVNWSLLITGETGTGKTTLARFIHDESARRHQPFVAINSAAMPKDLVESKLFGHVRGAFTGAVSDQPGAFESAHGGTLFFDEIGDLSLEAQAKLLTAIEQKVITRVGSNKSIQVDVRVIAATARSINDMIKEGSFREDLYHRISFLEIEAPPLSSRREDIPQLAAHLASLCAHELDLPALELDRTVIAWLQSQSYPGNIRELSRTISRLGLKAARSGSRRVEECHIQPARRAAAAPTRSQVIEIREDEDLETATARVRLAIIESALAHNSNNLTRTAQRLGADRCHLPKMVKTLKEQLSGRDRSPIEVIVC